MNNNSTTCKFPDLIDNHGGLRLQPRILSSYEAIIFNKNSDTEIECTVAHTGVQRTIISAVNKGDSFEFISYKVGDILPRNKVVLKPLNWKLANNTKN
jgi:hypothetical protein